MHFIRHHFCEHVMYKFPILSHVHICLISHVVPVQISLQTRLILSAGNANVGQSVFFHFPLSIHCALIVKGMQPALVYLLAAPAWRDSLNRRTESLYLWGFWGWCSPWVCGGHPQLTHHCVKEKYMMQRYNNLSLQTNKQTSKHVCTVTLLPCNIMQPQSHRFASLSLSISVDCYFFDLSIPDLLLLDTY